MSTLHPDCHFTSFFYVGCEWPETRGVSSQKLAERYLRIPYLPERFSGRQKLLPDAFCGLAKIVAGCKFKSRMVVVADWFDDDTEHLRFRIITDSNRRGNKRFRLKCKEGSNQARVSFVTSHVCAMPPLTCRSAVGWLVPNRTRCKSGNTKRRHKRQIDKLKEGSCMLVWCGVVWCGVVWCGVSPL